MLKNLIHKVKFRWPYLTLQNVHINIVSGCQLKCLGCPRSILQRDIKLMSVEGFNECLKNIDVKYIYILRLFIFGEPLLHPHLKEILLQIPKQLWTVDVVEISTNGQYFDEKQITDILKTGVLKRLYVSCDGNGTAEDYERLRPPAKWKKLLYFLSRTKELRDKFSPDMALMTRTCCETTKGRERWKELLYSLGWEPEFRKFFLLSGAVKYPGEQRPIVPDGSCIWTEGRFLFVDYDYSVVPCCNHPRASVYGNLRHKKYSKVLHGKERKLFLNELRSKRKHMPICGNCGTR